MIRKAQEVIFELYSKLPNQPSTIQPKVLRHITGSLNRQKLDAMIDLARSVESVSCKNSMFNTNPFLLCVANGVVDLQKGTLLPFEKSYLISIQTNIKYSKDAKCPRWDAWLKQMQPKEEMREYLQRAAGYTLTGDVSEQCLFFCHGVGMNGKTTFVETLCKLLGEYHLKSNAKALMVKKNDSSINNDVAQMAGRRMVSASELNDNQQFDESVVKDITGGDAISARFLHKEFFEFHAGFKLWLYGNHEPRVKGKDLGIWRRIKKIWWKVTISESEKDGFLQEKFGLELDGILAWAVEGCKKWVTDGLHEPEDIKQAVEEYKQSMDSLSDFFEEYCVFHPQAKISKAELWEAYRAYLKKIEEKGYEHQRGFNAEIKQRQGISEVRMGNSGAKGWQGIELQATSLFDSRPPTETDPNSSIFSHEENSKQITENSPVLGRESVLEPDLDEDEIIEE
jgi:putative DNA primase/helicase